MGCRSITLQGASFHPKSQQHLTLRCVFFVLVRGLRNMKSEGQGDFVSRIVRNTGV